MTTWATLIDHPALQDIKMSLERARQLQNDAAYNIFSLSTYNSHLENFHSDIIASLLSPSAMHYERDLFLKLFIHYLNRYYDRNISVANYTAAVVQREQGRLDITIVDRHSGHCIIIENKINNAEDMDEQLLRYSKYAIERNYIIDVIIYLSLDGTKKAPIVLSDSEQRKLVLNIGAFTSQPNDLVNGWLQSCYSESKATGNQSLLYQYSKLIKHQNSIAMLNDTMEQFYQFVASADNYETCRTINELTANIGTYRRDKFQKKWNNDFAPFKNIQKLVQYGNCGTVFENLIIDNYNYKLDVYFDVNGSAMVRLWTPASDNLSGHEACKNLLARINMQNEFIPEKPQQNSSMLCKQFLLSDYNSMIHVDDATFAFVKNLINSLAAIQFN